MTVPAPNWDWDLLGPTTRSSLGGSMLLIGAAQKRRQKMVARMGYASQLSFIDLISIE
jgi:hypothetical protein